MIVYLVQNGFSLTDILGKNNVSPNGMTIEQIEYFTLACRSLESHQVELTAWGAGKGFGGSSPEGDKLLRKLKRTLYDELEMKVRRENKQNG